MDEGQGVHYTTQVCNETNKRGYSEEGYASIKDSLRKDGQANCETMNGTACDEDKVCAYVTFHSDQDAKTAGTLAGKSSDDLCALPTACNGI
jgi:hypothetical protein